MREAYYNCAPHLCDEPSNFWFFVIVILVIVFIVVLLASTLQSDKKPDTLEDAVDKVLKGYEEQAQTWGDYSAEDAFRKARDDVRKVVAKYNAVLRA